MGRSYSFIRMFRYLSSIMSTQNASSRSLPIVLLPSAYILSVIRYPHSLLSYLRGCSIVVAMAPRVQMITHSDTSFLQDELCCL
jgi:hypothetical protein